MPTSVPEKVSNAGVRVVDAEPTPVPDSEIDCGEPLALSAMDMAADLAPVETGLNVTVK